MSQDLGLLGRTILRREANRARQRAAKLRALHNIGTVIISSTNVDQVLTRVVEAAVFISNAEEGSLLLLDGDNEELYLRAQKGLGEKYANGYRIRIEDSIAGGVVQSEVPQRLVSRSRDLKVVTGYMVNSILYVPVCGKNGAIGVLSVDNQIADAPFNDDDEEFLLILAGYAALALENARRIGELERRFEAAAGKNGGLSFTPAEGTGAEVGSIVLRPGDTRSPFAMLSADRLLEVVNPYLSALTEIQHCIDELAGRPPSQVRVLTITPNSPIVAMVEGIRETAAVIDQTVLPQQGYLDTLARRSLLAEKEMAAERARLEVLEARTHLGADANGDPWSTADIASRVANLEAMQDDCTRLGLELQQLKIALASDLVAWVAPDLSCPDTIQYVIRLLPALDRVLSSPLQLVMLQRQRHGQMASEGSTALLD